MKYSRTRQGMVRRKDHREQFNPHNGEPHTRAWLEHQRRAGLRRRRRIEVVR